MTSAQRTYGGVPAGERRRQRRAALIEAVLDLVATGGVAGLNVKAICAQARLNDRYFYENFRDCDEVVVAAMDFVMVEAVTIVAEALATTPRDTNKRVRACMEAAVEFVTADARRGALLIESQATAALRRKRQEVVRLLASMMAEQGSELLGPDAPSEAVIELVALTVVAGALELMAMWLRGDIGTGRAHFTDFLVAMILASSKLDVTGDS